MNRNESLRRLEECARFDLLIIGGGATGLGAAVDAASRGYSTALVEAGDFAGETSSRSTKLVHGGVRYLRQRNLSLVREALRERSALLANAPDLVHPLQFLLPVKGGIERWYYRAGLAVYDLLAGSHGIEPSRQVSRDEALALVPGAAKMPGFAGGILYSDAQFDDARLAITLARRAASHGAALANYLRVTKLVKRAGRVRGAKVVDQETGAEFLIKAKAVINATGVFCDSIRAMDEKSAPPICAPSQGTHLVLPSAFLHGDTAILIPETSDGRVLFAIPWHDRVLLGTTDVPRPTPVTNPLPLEEEIDFLVGQASTHLGWKITQKQVLAMYAGLRPLVRHEGAGATSALSRDHTIVVAPSGLVTITGGKWTTYRKMAEDAVNHGAEVAGLPKRACVTWDMPLDVPTPSGGDPARLDARLPGCWGEVERAIDHEMARTVEDVLCRRTRAAVLDSRAALKIAPKVAELIAARLGKPPAWVAEQTALFRERLPLASDYFA